jgi:hypothetical protein
MERKHSRASGMSLLRTGFRSGKLQSGLLLGCLAIFVALTALGIAGWIYGGPRFVSPRLYCASVIFYFLLPFPTIGIALLLPSRHLRIGVGIGLAPLAILGGFAALGYAIWNSDSLLNDRDPALEKIGAVSVDRATVVAYRTNGGAMDSYGIDVRQEFTLIPGVIWVHRLYRITGYKVKLRAEDPSHVNCNFQGEEVVLPVL